MATVLVLLRWWAVAGVATGALLLAVVVTQSGCAHCRDLWDGLRRWSAPVGRRSPGRT